MDTPRRRLPGWLLPAVLGLAVIALVVIALTRGPVALDPDTAEGTIQEYLLAISEERWDDAVAVIHDEWRGACRGEDLVPFSQGDFSAQLGIPAGFGGFIGQSTEGGGTGPTIPSNTTRVDVTITHDQGGGLGSTWEEYVTFEVADDGDFWWIVGDPWPYFVWNCR